MLFSMKPAVNDLNALMFSVERRTKWRLWLVQAHEPTKLRPALWPQALLAWMLHTCRRVLHPISWCFQHPLKPFSNASFDVPESFDNFCNRYQFWVFYHKCIPHFQTELSLSFSLSQLVALLSWISVNLFSNCSYFSHSLTLTLSSSPSAWALTERRIHKSQSPCEVRAQVSIWIWIFYILLEFWVFTLVSNY